MPDRITEAREWANRYAWLGWPVTPSCGVAWPNGAGCLLQDLHPANADWRQEVTTDRVALDLLWERRPAYGIITALGGAVEALEIDRPDAWSWGPPCLSAAGLGATVLRCLLQGRRFFNGRASGERVLVLVAPGSASGARLPVGVRVSLRRFLPLPATAHCGHVQWALSDPDRVPAAGLPNAADVAAALTGSEN